MDEDDLFSALSNPTRRRILAWLRDPAAHFQTPDRSPAGEGVCVSAIQRRTGLSQSTVSAYLASLERAGLVRADRRGQWTFYARDEDGIARFRRLVAEEL